MRATFFIPGWTVENHTDRAEMILRAGHEIGHHSYSHAWIEPGFPEKETEETGEKRDEERGLVNGRWSWSWSWFGSHRFFRRSIVCTSELCTVS